MKKGRPDGSVGTDETRVTETHKPKTEEVF